MNANQWRLWFARERLHLHNLLHDAIAASDNLEQKMAALYEHDKTLQVLARHAQKRIARADLVTTLARRSEQQ